MKLSERIESVNSIAIAGHTRPDGDCVGSCMGLYNYLKENYPTKEVTVYLEDAGNGFAYINRIDEAIDVDDEEKQVDLFILLDTSDLSRIGVANKLFENAKSTICIDHHISNHGLAMENIIVPNASSAAEVLFDLLDEDKISKETAEAIYTGIIHDSGVFKYASTSEHTMNIAGKLMSKGIDFQTIIDDGFYAKTYAQNQILGSALLESVRFFDGKCIFSVVTAREMEFFGVTNKDLGGIVEQMRLTEGVECAIFLYEVEPLTYKVH